MSIFFGILEKIKLSAPSSPIYKNHHERKVMSKRKERKREKFLDRRMKIREEAKLNKMIEKMKWESRERITPIRNNDDKS